MRLKSAYIVTYVDHIEDDEGKVTEIHVEYHPNSKSGSDTSGIKAKGTQHWVECAHAVDAEVRLYDRLFSDANPDGHKDKDFMEFLNQDSLKSSIIAKWNPRLRRLLWVSLGNSRAWGISRWTQIGQRERLVFNRAVTLKDGWKGKG